MVPDFRKILFATDLSENSRHAFSYAAAEATRHGASMVLMHVLDRAPGDADRLLNTLLGPDTWSKLKDMQQRTVRDVLIGKRTDYEIIQRALSDYYVGSLREQSGYSFEAHEVLITEGAVADEILKVADERGCNLIVIGSHKGLFGKTSVGSVVKNLLHGARVPVLVVPPPAP